MLKITSPIKEGDTVSVKLITGEECIARIQKINDDSYVLHKPLSLLQSPQGMVLGQFMMTGDPDADITMPKSSVLCFTQTQKDMASKYTEATTGIKI
jgi:hypothetical protein